MPVYLLHGFRWPRAGNSGIRAHGILNNLEDCSVEYIQNENSTEALRESFHELFPDIMKDLEAHGRKLVFLEQYDPDDVTSENAVSQPFAFVGDKVVTIAGGPKAMVAAGLKRPGSGASKGSDKTAAGGKTLSAVAAANGSALSVNVEEVVADGPGLTTQAWEALAELRDKLAENEKIGWWVVYNGDPERAYEDDEDDEDDEDQGDATEEDPPTSATMLPARQKPRTHKMSSDEKNVADTTSMRSKMFNKEMPPPPPPLKDYPGTGTASGRGAGPEKSAGQEHSKPRTLSRTEGLKKFFGKKSST